jgi:hypothetical protein
VIYHFKKKAIGQNNNSSNPNVFKTANAMNVHDINNSMYNSKSNMDINTNGMNGQSPPHGTSTKSGLLSKQFKNYYGSPVLMSQHTQPKIRESIDMDSDKQNNNINGNNNNNKKGGIGQQLETCVRNSYGNESQQGPLDRQSIIVQKSVLYFFLFFFKKIYFDNWYVLAIRIGNCDGYIDIYIYIYMDIIV